MATITRTARQIVLKSLRKIHVIGQGQTLEAEQENDAFSDLNEMLALMSADGFVIPYITQESFSVTSGTQSYSIGSGATWDTDRPVDIKGGYIRSGGSDYYLKPMGRRDFNSISLKGSTGIPEQFYYRDGYPNGTVYFDYTPSISGTVYLELEKPLGSISSLTSTISLPPEYHEFIWSNLCIRLAPEYETQVPTEVAVLAEKSESIIKRRNFADRIPTAQFDAILTTKQRFDIENGW